MLGVPEVRKCVIFRNVGDSEFWVLVNFNPLKLVKIQQNQTLEPPKLQKMTGFKIPESHILRKIWVKEKFSNYYWKVRNSRLHFFDKNFVKVTFFMNEIARVDFTKYFYGERVFLILDTVIAQCDKFTQNENNGNSLSHIFAKKRFY